MINDTIEIRYQGEVLSWLGELGWETYDNDSDGDQHLDKQYNRTDKEEVIYWNLLEEWLVTTETNSEITEKNVNEILNPLKLDLDHDALASGNYAFHKILTEGKEPVGSAESVSDQTQIDSNVDLIDFEKLENNEFIAVCDFQVTGSNGSIRTDITLFINGIPIATIELSSIAGDNDFYGAIRELKSYEKKCSELFVPALFNIAADQRECRYAPIDAPQRQYMPWLNSVNEPAASDSEPEQAIKAMCDHETLLNLIQNYTFHQTRRGSDGRLLPRHMEYYAVEEILDFIKTGDHKQGLVRHVQGSGKSLTMLFTAQNLLHRTPIDNQNTTLSDPQVIIVVDTEQLESRTEKLMDNIEFSSSDSLQFDVARSSSDIQQLLADNERNLILTTVQKFTNMESDLQNNNDTVVLSDEAYQELSRDFAMDNSGTPADTYHIGFTGTPTPESGDGTLRNNDILDSKDAYVYDYSIESGIDDGLVLPVYFDTQEIEWDINQDDFNRSFDTEFSQLRINQKSDIISEHITQTEIAELRSRASTVARSVDDHYRGIGENKWKGMVVAPTRKAAALYAEELLKYRDPEEIEVIYTSDDPGAGNESGDKKLITQFHTTSEERNDIIRRFENPDKSPNLIVVCDSFLTEIDSPAVKVMYLDRNIQNKKLLKAIARTNRPAEQKNNGVIIDYQGVFDDIDHALDFDDAPFTELAAQPYDDLFKEIEQEINDLLGIFKDIDQDSSQQTLFQCLSRVSSHPEKRKFKQGFRRVRDLYETLAHDSEMTMRKIKDNYRWLLTIYIAFCRNNNRNESPTEGFGAQTNKLIEQEVELSRIKESIPIYEFNRQDLEKMTAISPIGAKANSIEVTLRSYLHSRAGDNPRYEEFAKQADIVIIQRQRDSITDSKAVNQLVELCNEILEFESELSDQGLSDASYKIYLTLIEDYRSAVDDEEAAKYIAQDLWEVFKEEIQTDFEGWKKRDSTRKQIRKLLIQRLLDEHGASSLAKDDAFLKETIGHLIENTD